MKRKFKMVYFIYIELIMLVLLITIIIINHGDNHGTEAVTVASKNGRNYIKWVEFNVTNEALSQALRFDIDTHETEIQLNWIELLAYLGTKYGGDFSRYKAADMKKLVDLLLTGEENMGTMTEDMKYYPYYYEAYAAVLGGMVGEYEVEVKKEGSEDIVLEKRYGLKAFSPIARDFYYYDYDDFGASRSYGFNRKHLGHDMMGSIGSPIIAVESGYVEVMGWNQYGGWRIGIRSFDEKRYYYYAHLRKDMPFHTSLEEGDIVTAGDVIGYLGRTGYSTKENTNNINTAHLHFGIQLIFDESQKEGNNEIWIDCYSLTKFLYKNRSLTVRDEVTKDYNRVYDMIDPAEEYYKANQN